MPRLDPVTLVGRHVRLEPLALEYADALLAAANTDRTHYGFTDVPASPPAIKAYIENALAHQQQGTELPFVVLDESGVPVGSTRYLSIEWFKWPGPPPEPLPAPGAPDVLEIGATWYAERVQRTAVNTECKLLLLTHAFETLRVRRVTLKTDSRNQRSRNAIERIGAKFEGVIRVHRPALPDGGIRHTAYFSILAEEWPAAREKLTNALSRPPR